MLPMIQSPQDTPISWKKKLEKKETRLRINTTRTQWRLGRKCTSVTLAHDVTHDPLVTQRLVTSPARDTTAMWPCAGMWGKRTSLQEQQHLTYGSFSRTFRAGPLGLLVCSTRPVEWQSSPSDSAVPRKWNYASRVCAVRRVYRRTTERGGD